MVADADRSEIPTVAVVTPVFNESENLERYADEVRDVLLSQEDARFRILFVDDGSTDDSWARIQALCADDERLRGLRLSRNHGSHTALTAGFLNVEADAISTLACDLQDPPKTILDFIERWRDGVDIVWGERRTREDTSWRVLTSRLFHRLLQGYAMPPGSRFTTGSFFLIDGRVLECFQQFREHNRITFALVAWTGFDQDRVLYDRRPRIAGRSGWDFGRMIKAMYDAFVGFSTLPIRIMRTSAALAFLLAVVLVVYLLVVAVSGTRVPGWTSEMLVLAMFFGVQFSLMAISGEYLYRIYTETVRRPLYFVSDTTEGDARDGVL